MHKKTKKYKEISEQEVTQYIIKRFEEIKKSKNIKDLVNFQASNKYMLMAHDQEKLKIMGNLVANHKKKQLSEILEEYEMHLISALKNSPSIKKHTNVILHIFGYFSKKFEQHEKEKFFDMLEKFKDEKIEIGKILAEINLLTFKFNNTYLASQTYFLIYSAPDLPVIFQTFNTNSTQNMI